MKDRNLVSLKSRGAFLRAVRASADDRFQATVIVERESNLLEIATATIEDIVLLFGMDYFRDSFLAGQVPEILAGRFPR
jgi:hypothetical protein